MIRQVIPLLFHGFNLQNSLMHTHHFNFFHPLAELVRPLLTTFLQRYNLDVIGQDKHDESG